MQIGSGDHRYVWHEDWAKIPDTPSGRISGRTHGVATLADGRVVVFAQSVPAVLFFDAAGQLVDAWGDRFVGAHGLTVQRDADGAEALWLVDQYSAEVSRYDLAGRRQLTLEPPPLEARPQGKYVPTWADVNKVSGDVFVADGYGGSVIHRFSSDGRYQQTLAGTEGAGRFDCPHALRFGHDGRMYIADRGNRRIAVYDGVGKYLFHRDDVTHSPCGFDFRDGLILVPELYTGVKLLDEQLDLVAELGASDRVTPADRPDGWPQVDRSTMIEPGRFNSPHGACFGPDGEIYVVEWIVGGRITKLEKV